MTMSYAKFSVHEHVLVDGVQVDAPRSAKGTTKVSVAPSAGIYRNVFKRFADVALVVLSAPFVIPIIAILAIVVSQDGGKPFYSQPRVGRGGRVYRLWKLRSMVHDADARLEAYLDANPEARREWDVDQKLKNDPRITSFGRILRRSSLDELPQLWNVLMGDMSLIGPRPMMVCQIGLYPGTTYYSLRPGITGLWQVSGRSQTTFEARAGYDDTYGQAVSLWQDVKILMKTVGVVLKCTGR